MRIQSNCGNLNEVLVEGADPEFDDTTPFRNELEQVVFEDIEYEIESESFTLDENSKPSNKDVKNLCSCIWNKFPTDGWEREISKKIREMSQLLRAVIL